MPTGVNEANVSGAGAFDIVIANVFADVFADVVADEDAPGAADEAEAGPAALETPVFPLEEFDVPPRTV